MYYSDFTLGAVGNVTYNTDCLFEL